MRAGKDVKKIVKIQEKLIEILSQEKTLPLEKALETVEAQVGASKTELEKAVEELERGFIVERRREGCRDQLVYNLA